VAAHLSKGVALADVGDRIKELFIYRWARPVADKEGIQGWVVHIDRFGNLVTNIPGDVIQQFQNRRGVRIYVGSTILKQLVNTFGDVKQGESVAYIGSAGMLEVAVNGGNAEQMLGVYKGAAVSLVYT
jgi:S-adenosylmethionine hydrolase